MLKKILIFGICILFFTSIVFSAEGDWVATYDISAQSGENSGICWDGTNWYITLRSTGSVDKYNSTFNFIENINPSEGGNNWDDCFWDGSYFWIVTAAPSTVYKYNSSWNYQSVNYSIASQDNSMTAIFFDGTNWYGLGSNSDDIFKYDSSWTYQNVSYDLSSYDGNMHGLYKVNNNWYTVGYNGDKIYKFNSDFSSNVENLSISTKTNYAFGLSYDETNFAINDIVSDDVFLFEGPAESTCTYSSGNWNILLSDNCVITDNVDLGANNLIISGDAGTLEIQSTITAKEIRFTPDDFDGDSIIKITSGGSLSAQP